MRHQEETNNLLSRTEIPLWMRMRHAKSGAQFFQASIIFLIQFCWLIQGKLQIFHLFKEALKRIKTCSFMWPLENDKFAEASDQLFLRESMHWETTLTWSSPFSSCFSFFLSLTRASLSFLSCFKSKGAFSTSEMDIRCFNSGHVIISVLQACSNISLPCLFIPLILCALRSAASFAELFNFCSNSFTLSCKEQEKWIYSNGTCRYFHPYREVHCGAWNTLCYTNLQCKLWDH